VDRISPASAKPTGSVRRAEAGLNRAGCGAQPWPTERGQGNEKRAVRTRPNGALANRLVIAA
jgi:hypothetical protein